MRKPPVYKYFVSTEDHVIYGRWHRTSYKEQDGGHIRVFYVDIIDHTFEWGDHVRGKKVVYKDAMLAEDVWEPVP